MSAYTPLRHRLIPAVVLFLTDASVLRSAEKKAVEDEIAAKKAKEAEDALMLQCGLMTFSTEK